MIHDPMVRSSWAERPSNPLSNIYLTREQIDAVHEWLEDVIARVREDERQRQVDGFKRLYSAVYGGDR